MNKIDEIKIKYQEVLEELKRLKPSENWEAFADLTKQKDFLKNILDKNQNIKDLEKRIEDNEEIKKEGGEIALIAEEEIISLRKEIEDIQKKISEEIKKNKGKDSIIIEIRGGTGGDEAALFAADLFNAYAKFINNNNWKLKVLSTNQIAIGGYKEIIFEISGEDVYSVMQNEAGIHRVQRIPKTEKAGRIHTSTISVAVLLKPKKSELKIKREDLKIDVFRSSGPGGQNVNKRETAVRITHIPTGTVVASQVERKQLGNRENAMALLEARLLEKQREETISLADGIKSEQIKSAKRSDKIRTYNYPQNRITDHRIGKSWHNLDEVMQGKMDDILKRE